MLLPIVAGVSFIDDIHSLPDSLRLVVQFGSMGLALWEMFSIDGHFLQDSSLMIQLAFALLGLVIFVGASNIINFMDGINGITGGYSLAVLIPLYFLNNKIEFIDESLLIVVMLSLLVFCLFNFRPRGKAKCFAGDVGSIGIAFIMVFLIGVVVMKTGDVSWYAFLLVYGVDGCLTICHRIMLHENLGEAHRKHAYQLMANELKMSHVTVSFLYVGLQLIVSLGMIYLVPDTVFCHWCWLIGSFIILAVAYVLFKKKYYHLHEEYLASLKK